MATEEAVPPASRERYGPLVHRSVRHGAILWIVGVLEFLVGMIVTQLGWTTSYSLSQNYISDLGAVNCGMFDGRYVCSPWHEVFNVSIVLLGLLLIFGTILIRTGFPSRGTRTVGLALLVISGIGAIGVGLSPEDVNITVHTISALAAFAGGSLALIVLGIAMFRDTRWDGFRAYSVFSGLVSLIALFLFVGGVYGPLGVGGMERLIVAPVLLWALVCGIHLARIPTYAPPGVREARPSRA
ncbi:MAG: DUF998 domain-containing protein [Thermoplasmata archaeon]